MSDDAPTPAGDAGRDPWPAPASDEDGGPQDAGPKVPLDKGAAPSPWAAPGGPGGTLASNEPLTPAPAAPQAAQPSVHDQMTVTSLPGVTPDTPAQPWAGPGALGSFPPPHPATAAGGPPPNPFAPPVQDGSVPPPPIAPDGPGQVPYGYPGGYPHQHPGYFGWPGAAESNGMGITGLVLGIISAAVFCLWPVAIILGILGVVFGAVGRGKARRGEATNPGQALAGIICGTVGIVLGIGLGTLFLWAP
ncbi:hypothetical protein JCM4814A_30970 [Streptomyces phaeofaciens JCM 4814]|uniref:DUF4190 domain-containing protein n=1 Tax=Streptomyces phaeofaciens TaxID=68254 RepID=A0A918HKZ4_9ACTN|nr:DUF4190 domain-containing protein [Streptomyces phaeofaciens]GGT67241.1 hypothetical protein GCM10010226_51300 [Streptomyces phaeofaciens]